MKPWQRGDRVGKLVAQIVADRLLKGLSDRDLEGVVVTGAKMSPDIKGATIYFQVMEGDEDPARVERTLAALERAKHRLHQELRQQMKIKYIPSLRFCHDASLDRIQRLESIFHELDAERRDES